MVLQKWRNFPTISASLIEEPIMSNFLFPQWWWSYWPPVQRQFPYSVKDNSVEPSPLPWHVAASSLLATISVGEVASSMAKGAAKSTLGKQVDAAISAFIDGCGTNPPGWWPPWLGPWPPGPGPDPGYLIASELAIAANTVVDGTVRNEILRVAGQIIERASGSTKREDIKVPSDDELVAMTAFPSNESECEVLCEDFLDTLSEIQHAPRVDRPWLKVRLRALRERMHQLKCRPCLPS